MMGNTTPGYGSQPPPGSDAPFDDDCPDCGAPPYACECETFEPDDDAYIPDAPGRW
jgi:hypothetical protein